MQKSVLLSFATDNTALNNAFFGQGTGPIFLDNLACVGSEPMLTNCTHDTHTADCGHNEDASVRCSGTRKFRIKVPCKRLK